MKRMMKLPCILLFTLISWVQVAWAVEEERSFKVINAANGLADNSAQIVKCTKTGRLVISTIGNINFYDGKNFSHADTGPEYEYRLPMYRGHYHLYFDLYHHIWLKDRGKVACLDLITETFTASVDSVIRSLGCNDPVHDIFGDQYNNLWLLTNKGLYSPRHKMLYRVLRERNLQDVDFYDGIIYSFYDNGEVVGQDTLGNIVCQQKAYEWQLGQDYAGSSVLQPFGDGFFQIRNGEGGGILLYFDVRQRSWEIIRRTEYRMNNMTLSPDSSKLYIPAAQGYLVYTPATREFEHITHLELTTGETMTTDCNTMVFDLQGGLWIGTEKRGLLYARPHSLTFKSYPIESETGSHYVALMADQEQNITEYAGERANCKFVDSRGWTWVGTRRGLVLETGSALETARFSRKHGVNNNVIRSVIEDRNHNIWVATSCGITFFLIKDGKVAFINNFTSDDNVPTETFENCKAKLLPDGSIAMQAVAHVIVFRPEDLDELNQPHLVTNINPKLIRMLVNGNSVSAGMPVQGNVVADRAMSRVKHLNLNSDQNSVSLTFSALNYYRPIQTYYRVRIPERGDRWQIFSCLMSDYVDNEGMLHLPLSNLKPGNYHVEVQTSMFPDQWEENLKDNERYVWELHVKQPWWRTTGLFVAVALVLLALIVVNFILYNRNTRLRVRRNSEEGDIIRKIRFFAERCEAFSTSTFSFLQDDQQQQDAAARLSPEFIDVMVQLIPFVSTNKNRMLTMHMLSDACQVDIVKLYEVVTANLYKSPRELARLLRLKKAAEQLAGTEKTVEQIATDCGFYTPNYFIGNFFHEYKQTPKEYREAHKSS